jgi:3-ketosteroid 9alpha-monooxygenase subunit A
MQHGWFQVAFSRDLPPGALTTLDTQVPLVALRTRKGVCVFDAHCPHRGAHLGLGAAVDGGSVRCAFHGHVIRVGGLPSEDSTRCVRQHAVLEVGGMVLVRVCPGHDNGLTNALQRLDRECYLISGMSDRIGAPHDWVIENGFDAAHFETVHALPRAVELAGSSTVEGGYLARGTFTVPPSAWQRSGIGRSLLQVGYEATAYSSAVMISRMGGADPYTVITSSTPVGDRLCTVRLTIAVPQGIDGSVPSAERCQYLVDQTEAGIRLDQRIWERIEPSRFGYYDDDDGCVAGFRRYLDDLGRSTSCG